jgi:RNA polymerase sigma-70 factor (TIGR02960 family)
MVRGVAHPENGRVALDLLGQAKRGDADAFRQLVDPFRRELEVHCYRILGSAQDAEDATQEIMLAAWEGLAGFEGRSSIRTWLYRVATRRCLNALRSASRRPVASSLAKFELPPPTRLGEVPWLEPYPDDRLAALAALEPGPEARFEAREAISLAFVTALQKLPPRQRAALVLRDVLGYRAREAAEILESTEESVTSALKRARATLQTRLPASEATQPAPAANSPAERRVIDQLAAAFEVGDVEGMVALLTDDAVFAMPPLPFEYHGRESAARFLAAVTPQPGERYRLRWTRANGQPAFVAYLRETRTRTYHAMGFMVLTLSGNKISAMTRFENGVLPVFGLPRTVSD